MVMVRLGGAHFPVERSSNNKYPSLCPPPNLLWIGLKVGALSPSSPSIAPLRNNAIGLPLTVPRTMPQRAPLRTSVWAHDGIVELKRSERQSLLSTAT